MLYTPVSTRVLTVPYVLECTNTYIWGHKGFTLVSPTPLYKDPSKSDVEEFPWGKEIYL